MLTLNEDMIRIVTEQRLGFVATISADGWPNLSPKGTMVALNDRQIAFAEIRSPNTVANLAHDPRMEINFVDPFVRQGYRFRGRARVVAPGETEFADLLQRFHAIWPSLSERMRAFVVLDVERALAIKTPPYDTGTTQAELRQAWTDNFRKLQPGGEFLPPGTGWKA